MRRLAWLSICLAALLALSAWLRLSVIPPDPPTAAIPAIPAQSIPDALLAQAIIRIAYALPEQNWLEFNLIGNGQVVRVLSNAGIKPDAPLPAEPEFSYTLRYQLLGTENSLLSEQTYTHRSHISMVHDAASGQDINSLFFLDASDRIAGTRSFLITLPAATPARKLRLQLATADPAVNSIVVRAYHQNYPPEQRLDTLWQRLSYARRERLAEPSVYAPALLSQQERRNLVRQEWEPLGPEGTPSQDYIPRQLYVLRDLPEGKNSTTQDTQAAPAGLPVGPQLAGVITVPAGGSELQLQVVTNPMRPDLTTAAPLSLLWYPATALTAQRLSFDPGNEQVLSLPAIVQGGVLEILSPQDLTLRAFLQMADSRLEITPQPRLIPAFQLAPGEQLDYAVKQSGKEATPLRIDVRQLLQPDQLPLSASLNAATLNYAWLGPADALIEQGEIRQELLPSRYDRPASRDLTGLLTEPGRAFLRAPATAHRLRLHADRPLLISLYTRPPQLVHALQIPEAYSGSDPDYRAQPAWFSRRPARWRELIQSRRQVWLALQQRPPQERPELLTGQYELIDYQPLGQWTGRYLLTPRQPGPALQEWSRAVVYRQLEANQTHTLRFSGPPAQPKLTPTLLYQRPQASPFAITLYLDGKKRLTTRLAGHRGQLQLPPIAPGQHTLRLQTGSPGQWLLNYTGAEPPAFTKRLSYRLDRQALQFKYRKQSAGDEVLSLRWHASTADQGRSQLRVSVQGPAAAGTGPFPHWTLRERRYHVAAGSGPPSMVLGTQDQWTDSGQTFFLPLGSDLAPGEYLIRLALQQGPPGYISVYRLQAGVFAERRLSVEQLFNDQ